MESWLPRIMLNICELKSSKFGTLFGIIQVIEIMLKTKRMLIIFNGSVYMTVFVA